MGNATKVSPAVDKPENMAEALRLAYDAQQANDILHEVGSPDRRRETIETADETTRYKISPKDGSLTAVLWKPEGTNWTQTNDERVVTKETPFVATLWTYSAHGSNGGEFKFYSNGMARDGEGQAVGSVWHLRIDAQDLDGLKIVEEKQGEVVSEWIGRHAVLGAIA